MSWPSLEACVELTHLPQTNEPCLSLPHPPMPTLHLLCLSHFFLAHSFLLPPSSKCHSFYYPSLPPPSHTVFFLVWLGTGLLTVGSKQTTSPASVTAAAAAVAAATGATAGLVEQGSMVASSWGGGVLSVIPLPLCPCLLFPLSSLPAWQLKAWWLITSLTESLIDLRCQLGFHLIGNKHFVTCTEFLLLTLRFHWQIPILSVAAPQSGWKPGYCCHLLHLLIVHIHLIIFISKCNPPIFSLISSHSFLLQLNLSNKKHSSHRLFYLHHSLHHHLLLIPLSSSSFPLSSFLCLTMTRKVCPLSLSEGNCWWWMLHGALEWCMP